MQIILYTTSSEKEKLNKSLQNALTLSGNLKEKTSVLNPKITIKSGNISRYNYCYIPDFGRYYFMSVSNVNNDLWEIDCNVDVLMSHKAEILNLDCIIEKQQNQVNNYIDDGSIQTDVRKTISTYNFPNGFTDNGTYVLLTAGAI